MLVFLALTATSLPASAFPQADTFEGKLQFEPLPEISVYDNEIVLANQRLVVKIP